MSTRVDRTSLPLADIRLLLLCLLTPALGGCITLHAADNIDTAQQIQQQYESMASAAEASGVDVDAILTEPPTDGDAVATALTEAAGIAERAAVIGEHSRQIEAMNMERLDRAAQQQAALNSFAGNLEEFEQAAAWTISQLEQLGEIDEKLLELEGYATCGGSALATASCAADIGVKAVSLAGMAGAPIPGVGYALAAFSAVTGLVAEIDEAMQRASLEEQRELRLEALDIVVEGALTPSFENVTLSMEYALGALDPTLQPPGWEDALGSARSDMDGAMSFLSGASTRLEALMDEAEAEHQPPLGAMTPEQMAEFTGEPVERFMDPAVVAYQRFWAEMNEAAVSLISAMQTLRGVESSLRSMMDDNRSATLAADQASNGDPAGASMMDLLRNDAEELADLQARMDGLELALAAELPNYSVPGTCPVRL